MTLRLTEDNYDHSLVMLGYVKAGMVLVFHVYFWPDRDSCERYSYLLILAGYCSEAGRKYKRVWITYSIG